MAFMPKRIFAFCIAVCLFILYGCVNKDIQENQHDDQQMEGSSNTEQIQELEPAEGLTTLTIEDPSGYAEILYHQHTLTGIPRRIRYIIPEDGIAITSGPALFSLDTGDILSDENFIANVFIHARDGAPSPYVYSNNKGYGYIDRVGVFTIPLEFDWGDIFCNGYATVRKDERSCIIDLQGNIVKEYPQYKYMLLEGRKIKSNQAELLSFDWENSSFYYSVTNDEVSLGIITLDGEVLLDIQTIETSFDSSMAKYIAFEVMENGYIKATELNPDKLDYDYRDYRSYYDYRIYSPCGAPIGIFGSQMSDIAEGCFYLKILQPQEHVDTDICNEYIYYTVAGKRIGDDTFEYASDFSDGRAAVGSRDENDNLRYGYIDHQGDYLIPPSLHYAGNYSEGLAVVSPDTESGYGVIDQDGAYVIPANPAYKFIYPFSNGMASVVLEESDEEGITRMVIINASGEIIYDQFDVLENIDDDLIKITQDGKIGLIDVKENVLIEPEFERIRFYNGGYVVLAK